MHVARYEDESGVPLWGILHSGTNEVSPFTVPIADWGPRLAADEAVPAEILGALRPASDLRLRAPVDTNARVFGIGMNYRSHLEKLGVTPGAAPAAFMKPHSAIIGDGEQIRYPITTNQLDYEVELVVVVGAELRSDRSAYESVLGYTLGNDISPRDVDRPTGGPDLYSMKAQDRTAPVGPWIATALGLGATGQPDLEIVCEVNGEVRQRAETLDMLFDIEYILNFINVRNHLLPGDIIFTGTTGGVGLEDGRFLVPDDEVAVSAKGIGRCVNVVGAKAQP